jgi:hypothetical protein
MSVQAPEATYLDVAGVSTALIDVGPHTSGISAGVGPPYRDRTAYGRVWPRYRPDHSAGNAAGK